MIKLLIFYGSSKGRCGGLSDNSRGALGGGSAYSFLGCLFARILFIGRATSFQVAKILKIDDKSNYFTSKIDFIS